MPLSVGVHDDVLDGDDLEVYGYVEDFDDVVVLDDVVEDRDEQMVHDGVVGDRDEKVVRDYDGSFS